MIQKKERVTSIDISNIAGRITIQPHEGSDILIQTTEEKKVDIFVKNETLFIQTKQEESEKEKVAKSGIFNKIFGGVNINVSSNTVVVGNGNVVIGGNSISIGDCANVEMTISVPKNTIEEIDACNQIELVILRITEKLLLDVCGQTKTTISGIDHVKLDVSGQSSIDVFGASKVKGDFSGQCNVKIESKAMKKVKLDTSGMVRVDVKSDSIEEVEVDMSGMGSVVIRGKVQKKKTDVTSMASVRFVNEN